MILSKNINNNNCAPKMIFFNEKKNQKDSNDFWHRKLTLKVKFWYFLTAPHYSNSQNLVISFEYSWFLAKNLSNFVSLNWKLHNQECHSKHISMIMCIVRPLCDHWVTTVWPLCDHYATIVRPLCDHCATTTLSEDLVY